MNASQIYKTVADFKTSESPYRCILIDGKWGTGKTYAVNKALNQVKYSIYVSLFGVKSVDQLYSEFTIQLIQLLYPNEWKKHSASKFGLDHILAKLMPNISSPIAGAFLSRESVLIYLTLLQKSIANSSNIILVFDDLERADSGLDIDELFGFIDSIKNRTSCKIILIANKEKLGSPEDENNHFFSYSEKIIDRIYNITEVSSEVWENNSEYNAQFVQNFWNQHRFSNLRTLQKAEFLFKDIQRQISDLIDSQQCKYKDLFLLDVQRICYGVVFETVDGIYAFQVTNEKDEMMRSLAMDIDQRIVSNYVGGFGDSYRLVQMIRTYYETNTPLNLDMLKAHLELLVTSGAKVPYYMSQEEIQTMIEKLTAEIKHSSLSLTEVCEKANSVVIWMQVLDLDPNDFIKGFTDKVYDIETTGILAQLPSDGRSLPFKDLQFICDADSYEVLTDPLKEVKKRIITFFWNSLFDTCNQALLSLDYGKAQKCLDITNENICIPAYHEDISANLDKVMVPSLCPSGSIDPLAYKCLHTICYICGRLNDTQVAEFLEQCKQLHPDDKMMLHRIKELQKNLKIL